jgi:hypothetical protein
MDFQPPNCDLYKVPSLRLLVIATENSLAQRLTQALPNVAAASPGLLHPPTLENHASHFISALRGSHSASGSTPCSIEGDSPEVKIFSVDR